MTVIAVVWKGNMPVFRKIKLFIYNFKSINLYFNLLTFSGNYDICENTFLHMPKISYFQNFVQKLFKRIRFSDRLHIAHHSSRANTILIRPYILLCLSYIYTPVTYYYPRHLIIKALVLKLEKATRNIHYKSKFQNPIS